MIDITEHRFKAGQTLPERAVREAIRKAAEGRAKVDSAISKGPRIDFFGREARAKSEPLARASLGELSALKLPEGTVDKRAKQFDALPRQVQKAAKERNVTDIDVLRAAAIVHATGAPLRIARSDLAERLGLTVDAAETAISGALGAGLISETPSFSANARVFSSRL